MIVLVFARKSYNQGVLWYVADHSFKVLSLDEVRALAEEKNIIGVVTRDNGYIHITSSFRKRFLEYLNKSDLSGNKVLVERFDCAYAYAKTLI